MQELTQLIQTWLGTGSINIFGLPFAGKDTQGKILADMFGGVMISGGDVLRHANSNHRVQDIMAAGDIIPSELFEEVVLPFFAHDDLVGKPLILSEVGRMDGEQQVIMRVTEQSNHPTKAVVLLNLPDDEVWKRFEAAAQQHDRGDRADDNRAVLQTRLDNYHQKVMPVIDWYKQKGLLVEIDGTKPREQVTQSMLQALAERAQQH